MNRYTMICRLRGPAFILLTGVIALLAEWHILSWGKAWPLYLILWGVLRLAERAALASMEHEDWSGPYNHQAAGTVPPAPVAPPASAVVPSIPENHSGEPGR